MDIHSLYAAIMENDVEMVKKLLTLGINPDIIIPAATSDKLRVPARFSKDLITDINALGNVTFLHVAAKNNYVSICRLLLEYRASTEITDEGGCTPLHWAVARNYYELVQLLIEYAANVNAKDLVNSTPLHESIRRNFIKVTELLLESGADPLVTDIFGETALELATDNMLIKNIILKFINHNTELVIKH